MVLRRDAALRGVCRRARKSVRFAKREEASISSKGQFDGRVTAIRGAVVDLVFEHGPPPIDDAVEIEDADGRIVVAEIQAQLDGSSARAIALEATTGLRRGDRVAPRRRPGHDSSWRGGPRAAD